MLKKICLMFLCFVFHISFAKQIKEVDIWQENQPPQLMSYEAKGEYAISEGDIILGKLSNIEKPGAVVINHAKSRWPNGVLPYKLADSMSTSAKTNVFLAFVHYQRLTSIRFIEVTEKNQQQYPDFVTFKPGNGCSSYVGKIGGEQAIILNSTCGYGAAIHEIGHALGFWHEQNRLDRDNYIAINFDNIISKYIHNFKQNINSSTDLGAYDYESIMHYHAYAFTKNGKETIKVLNGKHDIGQQNGLSDGDISAIKLMYSPSK